MKEIWKPVDDFENLYEISSLGRIKRLTGYTPRYRGERITPDSIFHSDGGDTWRTPAGSPGTTG